MSEDQPVPVEDAESPASPEGPESPTTLENPASAGDALDGGSGRPSFVRRLLRSRTARAVTAAGLAGVLLGAGAVAWRTDTLPLLGDAPCWDSLGDASVSGLFGDRRIEVDEQSLGNARQGDGLSYGQCRITSFKDDRAMRQVTVNVHQLDGLRGTDSARWPQEFLAAGMVSLGEGLPGMVSASRGWLALPQGCTGRGDFSGPTVVEIAMGRAGLDFSSDFAKEDRGALTDALVDAANGVIRSFGCSGRYPSPRSLPSVGTWQDTDAAALCGTKGFALPSAYRKELSSTLTGAGRRRAGLDLRGRQRLQRTGAAADDGGGPGAGRGLLLGRAAVRCLSEGHHGLRKDDRGPGGVPGALPDRARGVRGGAAAADSEGRLHAHR